MLQTIFYTLPRLSELAEDEWISLSKFDRFTDIPLPAAFQWCHSRTELRDLKPSDWSQQDMGKIEPVCVHFNYLFGAVCILCILYYAVCICIQSGFELK